MQVYTFLRKYVSALRPRQWIKNLLVLAAPFFGKVFIESLREVALAFIAFCAASSFGYLVNDWRDKEIDARHPIKKFRPFASRILKFHDLILLMTLLIVIITMSCYFLPTTFNFAIAAYLAITLSYSFYFKSVPVIEIVVLSLGFLVRAIGGALAVNLGASSWFLIFSGFGALFIISTKRLAEFKNRESQQVRGVISAYTESFLTTVLNTALTISLLTYTLWVFSLHEGDFWATLSILPVTVGFLRYSWHRERGDGETPERLIFGDPAILLAGLLAVISLAGALYR
jgi:decaprenyl-phosphate phosphoribosyltransferase